MSEELFAYCVKCKEKRPITNAEATFTKAAQPATRGECPVCGTSLYRMGETHAHEGMERPKPVKKAKKSGNGSKKNRRGKLVIVESPAKARTIENYLGRGYKVRASVGHVRDLLKSRLSVDVEHDFEPSYRVPNDKRDVVKELKQAASKAKEVYIATDPDREGEAIAWHLIEAAEIDDDQVKRVVFNEITKDAVAAAFEQPRDVDMDRVNAQQARRVLDRLVGYKLSPLLWEKVRPRLSAGRVQSVAVRIIVEREREIEAFVPEEYWTIDAELARQEERDDPKRVSFIARLHSINGEEPELPTQEAIDPIIADLEAAEYIINDVERGERRRRPSAPFITSTMQQEASRRLGFGAGRTMRLAQQLYEGMDVGDEGQVGLITYMRTDSVTISKEAQAQALDYVKRRYGEEYLPPEPRTYKTRAKGAQEAHEAVRPTSVFRTPASLKDVLNRDQRRLYELIWQRFVASQMASAVYDTMVVETLAGPPESDDADKPYMLRASGWTLRFPGYLAVYQEAPDEDATEEEGEDLQFPENLNVGDWLDLLELLPEQHFTQPPPRYTEASLVRALEEHGIGRPSTYAPIMSTIRQRGYVDREGKRLLPTDIGMVVNDLLVENFPQIVSRRFTASMEDNLDSIASGDREWVPVLREFYEPFEQKLAHAHEHVPNVDLGSEEVGRDCPETGHPLIVRWGRYGKFIGCSDFPTCRYTEPWLEFIGVTCPLDGGEIVERKTRKGRTFFGCENYPECEWTSWKRPVPDPCPNCGNLLIIQRRGWAQCTECENQYKLDTLPSQIAEKEKAGA